MFTYKITKISCLRELSTNYCSNKSLHVLWWLVGKCIATWIRPLQLVYMFLVLRPPRSWPPALMCYTMPARCIQTSPFSATTQRVDCRLATWANEIFLHQWKKDKQSLSGQAASRNGATHLILAVFEEDHVVRPYHIALVEVRGSSLCSSQVTTSPYKLVTLYDADFRPLVQTSLA